MERTIDIIDRLLKAFMASKIKDIFEKSTGKEYREYIFYNVKTESFDDAKLNKDMWSCYFSLSKDLSERIARIIDEPYPGKKLRLQCYNSGIFQSLKYPPNEIYKVELSEFIKFVNDNFESASTNFRLAKIINVLFELDDNYKKEYQKFDPELLERNRYDIEHCPLYLLKDNLSMVASILFCMKYDMEDIEKIINYMKADHKNDFPDRLLSNGVFKNNRLYLPLEDERMLVLSKNIWDYFWASTGNGFESCFSLNSPHKRIRALPLMGIENNHFMCYITRGETKKYGLFSGTKCVIPQIFARSWVHKDNTGNLKIDRIFGYDTDFIKDYTKAAFKIGDITAGPVRFDVDGAARKYGTYLDSLSSNHFEYCVGLGFVNTELNEDGTICEYCKEITYNELDVNRIKDYEIFDNEIMIVRKCPITGFVIKESEKQHWAAKYMDRPVKKMMLFSFVADERCERIYNISTQQTLYLMEDTVEAAKEKVQMYVNEGNLDAALLRIVDGNRTTFQPFYNRR